jgi:hypothetical protein
VTLQAHDRPQLRSRQEVLPLQSTLHRPVPHARFLQLCVPLQVITHVLVPQLTPLLHEPSPEHMMLQLQPVGQVTAWPHAPPLSAQSIVQLFVSLLHDVHCAGQVAGLASVFTPESTGATQKPSLQVRPWMQSDGFSHAKSPLRWLTEQLPATSANPRTASQSTASFTACLRS